MDGALHERDGVVAKVCQCDSWKREREREKEKENCVNICMCNTHQNVADYYLWLRTHTHFLLVSVVLSPTKVRVHTLALTKCRHLRGKIQIQVHQAGVP